MLAFLTPTIAHAQTLGTLDQTSFIANYIIAEAQEYGADPVKALYVANCESALNPNAVGDHGTSFGIYQIHLPAHPDISIEQAENPQWAAGWAIKKYMAKGDYTPWRNCTAAYASSSPALSSPPSLADVTPQA